MEKQESYSGRGQPLDDEKLPKLMKLLASNMFLKKKKMVDEIACESRSLVMPLPTGRWASARRFQFLSWSRTHALKPHHEWTVARNGSLSLFPLIRWAEQGVSSKPPWRCLDPFPCDSHKESPSSCYSSAVPEERRSDAHCNSVETVARTTTEYPIRPSHWGHDNTPLSYG